MEQIVTGFNKGIRKCTIEASPAMRYELKTALGVMSDPQLWRYASGRVQLKGDKLERVAAVFEKYGITDWQDEVTAVDVESKTAPAV